MKRKMIQLSPSTAVVSLPASWVKKNNLQKGEDLQVQQVENTLLISTSSKRTKQSITVDLRGLQEDMAFTYADAAYIAGYDEITFLTDAHQKKEVIQYVSTEVPGMIIVEQTTAKTVFKDITNDNQENIDALISRIFNMLLSMVEDAFLASKNKDWQVLKEIKKQDYVLNSYVSYAQRLINKFGYVAFSKTGLIITYLKLLEMFSDVVAQLAKKMSVEKVSLTKELELILELSTKIRKVHVSYSKENIISIDSFREKITTSKKEFVPVLDELRNLSYELIELEVQLHL